MFYAEIIFAIWLGSSAVEHLVEAQGVGVSESPRAIIERTIKRMKSIVRLRKTNIWTKVRTKPVRQALNLTRSLIWASSIRDGKRFVSDMIHNEESKVQRLGCPLIWAVGRVWLIAAPC